MNSEDGLLEVRMLITFIRKHLSEDYSMPVRKVGKDCYQWGTSGKVYCGKGAKEKAEKQGRAIRSTGWKEDKKKK